jgi:hypothetical protein
MTMAEGEQVQRIMVTKRWDMGRSTFLENSNDLPPTWLPWLAETTRSLVVEGTIGGWC